MKKDIKTVIEYNYYKEQMDGLIIDEYALQVQFKGANESKTKWLDVNVESIDEIVYYLQRLREDILKNK